MTDLVQTAATPAAALQIRQVSRYIFDVFPGVGWDGWTRVRKQHWGVHPIAGARIGKAECKVIEDVLHKHPYGTIQPVLI